MSSSLEYDEDLGLYVDPETGKWYYDSEGNTEYSNDD